MKREGKLLKNRLNKYKYIATVYLMKKFINISPFINFLIIVGIYFVILFIPYSIPNFIGINLLNISAISNIFTNISVVLSSIFGIIIAIFLVAFQLFKDRYVSYSLGNFFKDSNFLSFFILFLTTIILSLLSVFLIDNTTYQFTYNNIKNVIYYLLFLFILCLIYLYPFLKNVLTSDYHNKLVIRTIYNLKYSDIKTYLNKYSVGETINPDYYNEQKNPHLFLNEMFANAVKRRDGVAIERYFDVLSMKIMDLLSNYSEEIKIKEDVFKFFGDIFMVTAQNAIKENDAPIVCKVLDHIMPLYLYCFYNKLIDKSLNVLDNSFQEVLFLLIENKHILSPVRLCTYFFGVQVNIILIINKKAISDSENDCNLSKQIDILFGVINMSIENRHEYFAKEAINRLIDIYYEVLTYKDISTELKRSIISSITDMYQYFVLKLADRAMYDVGILIYAFRHDRLLDTLFKSKEYNNYPLIFYCELLVALLKKDILDDFDLENLNDIAEGIICKKDKEKIEDYESYLLYIMKAFNEFRRIIEQSSNTIVLHKYRTLCDQVFLVKDLIDKYKNNFIKTYEEINHIVETFKLNKPLYVQYKELSWPKLK